MPEVPPDESLVFDDGEPLPVPLILVDRRNTQPTVAELVERRKHELVRGPVVVVVLEHECAPAAPQDVTKGGVRRRRVAKDVDRVHDLERAILERKPSPVVEHGFHEAVRAAHHVDAHNLPNDSGGAYLLSKPAIAAAEIERVGGGSRRLELAAKLDKRVLSVGV